MKTIAATFANRFARWKISIPQENLENRESGYIRKGAGSSSTALGKTRRVNIWIIMLPTG